MYARRISGWVAFALVAGSAALAQPPAGPPPKPIDLLRQARELIYLGKYDLAAERLKELAAANPQPDDFLDMQRKLGNTVFNQLNNVARYNDNPELEKEARATIQTLIDKAAEANKGSSRNPERIDYFLRRLAGPREERIFAEQQLRSAGDALVPVAVDLLRTSESGDLRASILAFLPNLQPEVVPGLLAAVEGMPGTVKPGLLQAITRRADVLALVQEAETDFLPFLWYYAGSVSPELAGARAVSLELLNKLTAGSAVGRRPEQELRALAVPFIERRARFRTLDPAGDLKDTDKKVRLYSWDPATNKLKDERVSRDMAEEYYGLRYLRWALEISPADVPAQQSFVRLATERAVVRANFGPLAKAEPATYQLLAAAPTAVLQAELEAALREKRTALAVGTLNALADRTARVPAAPGPAAPAAVVAALDYPDARVQFAAALMVLNSPGADRQVPHAKLVNILRRALAADAEGMPEGTVGRALVADPDRVRGQQLEATFRDAGYAVERFATGRDLLRRVAGASDFDLIAVDRHVPDPLLGNLLAQLAAAPATARVPTLVVASSDTPTPVPFEHLLLRFALLVAAADAVTDPEDARFVPDTYKPDPLRPLPFEETKGKLIDLREERLAARAAKRLQRLAAIVEAADVPLPPVLQRRVNDRLPQLTDAILAFEFNVTDTSAPLFWARLKDETRVNKATAAAIGPMPQPKLADNLLRMIDPFEATMTAAHKERFEKLRRAVQPEPLGIAAAPYRDEAVEYALLKTLKPHPRVHPMPEPFGAENLKAEIKAATQDPATLPRDPAEKQGTAKQAAELLRRMAAGDLAGYDVKPAEPELRKALKSDDLAPDALEAVARLASPDAQQDLVNVALAANRPLPMRVKAADAAIRQVQTFGRLAPQTFAAQVADAAEAEKDAILKGKLTILANLLADKPRDFGRVLQTFPLMPAPKSDAPTPAPVPAPEKN